MSDNGKHIGVLTESALRECKAELARTKTERDAHRTQCVEYAKLSPEQAAEVEYRLGVSWMSAANKMESALRECEAKLAAAELDTQHARAREHALNAELDNADEALGRETRERSAAERKLKRLEQAAREAFASLHYWADTDVNKARDVLERALAPEPAAPVETRDMRPFDPTAENAESSVREWWVTAKAESQPTAPNAVVKAEQDEAAAHRVRSERAAAVKAERERVLALYPKDMAQDCYVREWRKRIASGEKP